MSAWQVEALDGDAVALTIAGDRRVYPLALLREAARRNAGEWADVASAAADALDRRAAERRARSLRLNADASVEVVERGRHLGRDEHGTAVYQDICRHRTHHGRVYHSVTVAFGGAVSIVSDQRRVLRDTIAEARDADISESVDTRGERDEFGRGWA